MGRWCSAERGDGLVERGGRPHHRGGLLGVGTEVAADVGRLALHGQQLVDDRLLGLAQRRGERGERLGQLGVLGLLRELLGDSLDRATETFLNEDRSPGRKLGTTDNRGSHFYLALYWAEELAKQTEDAQLADAFASLASTLREKEQTIVDELLAVQGKPADIGGYFRPDPEKADAVMRPSTTFNEALAAL